MKRQYADRRILDKSGDVLVVWYTPGKKTDASIVKRQYLRTEILFDKEFIGRQYS